MTPREVSPRQKARQRATRGRSGCRWAGSDSGQGSGQGPQSPVGGAWGNHIGKVINAQLSNGEQGQGKTSRHFPKYWAQAVPILPGLGQAPSEGAGWATHVVVLAASSSPLW